MSNVIAENVNVSGYQYLHDSLLKWGITRYAGLTGGGVVHFLKHLSPLTKLDAKSPAFFSIAEYSAGFMPLGYYCASGQIAAAVSTTGAAIKLLTCGMSDAKLHDIPAVYIVPLSGEETLGQAPLQDTSEYGSNIVAQLRSELPESVFVLDSISDLVVTLARARQQLDLCRPVVLVLLHSALSKKIPEAVIGARQDNLPGLNEISAEFCEKFRRDIYGKRLVVLVGEEMARYPNASALTTDFCQTLQCAAVWSINGANAVERKNDYGFGYISFGGNDEALALYQSLGENDILLVLGACPDEYTVNMAEFAAGKTYYLSHIRGAYGQIENSFRHMAKGEYIHVHAPLDTTLSALLNAAKKMPFGNTPSHKAPKNLNHRQMITPREGYVDMAELYQRLDRWWPADSIGFADVCLSYKDQQYVMQRPNCRIRIHSFYRGSAMGGTFGAAIGAKLSSPESSVFLFTGDGCFRLFSGSLGEASELGIVIFVLNNASYAIVGQGLPIIIPDVAEENYHASLKPLDYCAIARASGWHAAQLNADLSNLDTLLGNIERHPSKSMLIEVPVDALQVLGLNPRVRNL